MSEASIRAAVDALLAEINATFAPQPTVVRAGGNLQSALETGLPVVMEAGATFEGSYTLKSGGSLTGQPGAAIHSHSGPAVSILPGSSRVALASFSATSDSPDDVIAIGLNTAAQTKPEDAPAHIALTDVHVPTHRGKRAFAIHGQDVDLTDCSALDIWSAAGADSQALYVGNAPGHISIRGGRFSAGSEVFLSGGDTYQIPNLTPVGLTLDGVELFRPLSWQTDGVKRTVKNLFEVKNGRLVTLTNSKLHGCWADGQNGEAIVLTPALDGAIKVPPLRSGLVEDVLIDTVDVSDCGAVLNVLGRAYTSWTERPLTARIVRLTASVSRAKFGTAARPARGNLATISGEPASLAFDQVTFSGDGPACLYVLAGTVLDPVTRVQRPGGKLGSLTVTGSTLTAGAYGLKTDSGDNAANWQGSIGALTVTGNTFSGASSVLRKNLPGNTYL